jgi:hypothetical protein
MAAAKRSARNARSAEYGLEPVTEDVDRDRGQVEVLFFDPMS